VIAFLLLAAAWPALLATHSPTANDFAAALQPPSFAHWFGTDEAGRDLYSRVVWGARESLLIGAGAATVSLGLAVVLGTAAALGGRILSGVVGFVLEVAFAFPALLLALLLVAVLGPSAWTQVLAVGIGTAPGYARIVRAQVLAARSSGYVEAAVASATRGGASSCGRSCRTPCVPSWRSSRSRWASRSSGRRASRSSASGSLRRRPSGARFSTRGARTSREPRGSSSSRAS